MTGFRGARAQRDRYEKEKKEKKEKKKRHPNKALRHLNLKPPKSINIKAGKARKRKTKVGRETVEEFLARGGKIEKVPMPAEMEDRSDATRAPVTPVSHVRPQMTNSSHRIASNAGRGSRGSG